MAPRRLDPAEVEVTVVNAAADFVERLRLHHLAAGGASGSGR
ncbi:hypothetical protein [Actinocorallia aurea]